MIEKYYPLALSLVGTCAFYFSFPEMSVQTFTDFNRLGDHTLRINTVLLGFFLTMFSLISTIQTRRMVFVRTSGLYPQLLGYNRKAIFAQFISIIVVLSCSFYQFFEGNEILDRCIASALAFVIVYSYLAAFRFAYVVLILLGDPEVEE